MDRSDGSSRSIDSCSGDSSAHGTEPPTTHSAHWCGRHGDGGGTTVPRVPLRVPIMKRMHSPLGGELRRCMSVAGAGRRDSSSGASAAAMYGSAPGCHGGFGGSSSKSIALACGTSWQKPDMMTLDTTRCPPRAARTPHGCTGKPCPRPSATEYTRRAEPTANHPRTAGKRVTECVRRVGAGASPPALPLPARRNLTRCGITVSGVIVGAIWRGRTGGLTPAPT